MNDENEISLGIGGAGGVYFLVAPGELVVDVEKRDRNGQDVRTELRAILLGPDRQVLDEATIPDDGEPVGSGLGPPRRVRLTATVEQPGLYGLSITVSHDRYGDHFVWGFQSNCPHYLIETSRGHRDEVHQEPLVLHRPDRAGDVCFLPGPGAFDLDVAGLAEGVAELPVFDAEGVLVATLEATADGEASHRFAADEQRGEAPWRLHLPVQQAVVQIDGVTRWGDGDLYPDLCLWNPDPDSFFPLHSNRWLLTPYSRTVYGQPGEEQEVAFELHNNGARPKTVGLAIEFPAGQEWSVRLSTAHVELDPGESAAATLAFSMPPTGDEHRCRLRATAEDGFSTYSTLTAKRGEAPAAANLAMPMVLKPYRHENEQFGYRPDYPTEQQPYFDLENRPFVRDANSVASWRDGRWQTSDLSVADGEPPTVGRASTKIAFDAANDLYTLTTAAGESALAYSRDGGQKFAASALTAPGPEPCAFDIEQFSGHNIPLGPPPVMRSRRMASDPRLRWRSINQLELFLPQKTDDGLAWGAPIPIASQSLGLSAHSGVPSSIVSRGSRVHVTWAEATDPEEDVPGVPTFVATFDRDTGKLGEPVLIGHGPPPNDGHNSPCITMDSKGYLYVLVGTHGRTFKYARSLQPNDAYGGWTATEEVGPGLRQTYVGLVCDQDDTLHLVFRLWRDDADYHPASMFAALAHMRKRPGEPWEAPRDLIIAPFTEYSIYYHRLTIDRAGRLFLSYDYWSTYWFYRLDHHGRRRALLTSPDAGATWKLAETRDLCQT